MPHGFYQRHFMNYLNPPTPEYPKEELDIAAHRTLYYRHTNYPAYIPRNPFILKQQTALSAHAAKFTTPNLTNHNSLSLPATARHSAHRNLTPSRRLEINRIRHQPNPTKPLRYIMSESYHSLNRRVFNLLAFLQAILFSTALLFATGYGFMWDFFRQSVRLVAVFLAVCCSDAWDGSHPLRFRLSRAFSRIILTVLCVEILLYVLDGFRESLAGDEGPIYVLVTQHQIRAVGPFDAGGGFP